jgi:competence protein ComEA
MDATHHALGADQQVPPPAPSAPAPTPARVEDPAGGGRMTPASGHGRMTPASGHGRMTPASGHGRMTPASGHGRMTPASGHGRMTPASGHGRETPASGHGRGLRAALSRTFEGSVWAPVAAKASAIAVGMLGLAAIGAWSTLAGAGVPVNTAVTRASADAQGAWLAPDHATQHVGAPSLAASSGGTTTAPSPAPSAAPDPGPASGVSGVTPDGKVVLNTATAEELVKLPRVGPKRAQAILELRKRLGKFRKATDLLRVRGIGRKTLVLMLPKLVVDAPAEAAK